jgi:hypothetical protein
MADVTFIIWLLQVSLLAINIILAVAYSIPILLLRQFHHRLNIFTVNVSMAIICVCLFWFVSDMITHFNIRQLYNVKTCPLLAYAQMMCTIQLPLALVVVSIHRLCSVVYHTKVFFKRKQWIVMCVTCQWLVGIVVSLPILIRDASVRI